MPPRPPVVVLADEDGVAGTRLTDERRPLLGVEPIERQQLREVVVALHVTPPVAMVGEHLGHRLRMEQDVLDRLAEMAAVPLGVLADRRPRRHRGERRVDEDPEPALVPPRRHAARRHGSGVSRVRIGSVVTGR